MVLKLKRNCATVYQCFKAMTGKPTIKWTAKRKKERKQAQRGDQKAMLRDKKTRSDIVETKRESISRNSKVVTWYRRVKRKKRP